GDYPRTCLPAGAVIALLVHPLADLKEREHLAEPAELRRLLRSHRVREPGESVAVESGKHEVVPPLEVSPEAVLVARVAHREVKDVRAAHEREGANLREHELR